MCGLHWWRPAGRDRQRHCAACHAACRSRHRTGGPGWEGGHLAEPQGCPPSSHSAPPGQSSATRADRWPPGLHFAFPGGAVTRDPARPSLPAPARTVARGAAASSLPPHFHHFSSCSLRCGVPSTAHLALPFRENHSKKGSWAPAATRLRQELPPPGKAAASNVGRPAAGPRRAARRAGSNWHRAHSHENPPPSQPLPSGAGRRLGGQPRASTPSAPRKLFIYLDGMELTKPRCPAGHPFRVHHSLDGWVGRPVCGWGAHTGQKHPLSTLHGLELWGGAKVTPKLTPVTSGVWGAYVTKGTSDARRTARLGVHCAPETGGHCVPAC